MEPPRSALLNTPTYMPTAASSYDIQTSPSPGSTPPSRPAQVAQLAYSLPSSSRQPADQGYPACEEKHARSYRQSYSGHRVQSPAPLHGTSVSSAGGTSVMTGGTVDTIDLEKAAMDHSSRQSESRRSSRVARGRQEMSERQQNTYHSSSRPGSDTSPPYGHTSRAASVQSEIDDEEESLEYRRMLESKALKILLFLSGPCAVLSFVLCVYSLLATLAIFVLAPLRLCTKPSTSLWEQLLATLSSAQRLQLRCICAPTTNIEGKSVASLLSNLALSPMLSMGVALAGWTVAIYWIFAAIVGDPDGSEGGDDGKATVIGLRNWWERWLSRAIRD